MVEVPFALLCHMQLILKSVGYYKGFRFLTWQGLGVCIFFLSFLFHLTINSYAILFLSEARQVRPKKQILSEMSVPVKSDP